jgi:hypothetical protein
MCRFMRTVVFMVLLVGTVWVADQVAFDGRYSRAAWIEAKHHGQHFQHEISSWLKRTLRG